MLHPVQHCCQWEVMCLALGPPPLMSKGICMSLMGGAFVQHWSPLIAFPCYVWHCAVTSSYVRHHWGCCTLTGGAVLCCTFLSPLGACGVNGGVVCITILSICETLHCHLPLLHGSCACIEWCCMIIIKNRNKQQSTWGKKINAGSGVPLCVSGSCLAKFASFQKN